MPNTVLYIILAAGAILSVWGLFTIDAIKCGIAIGVVLMATAELFYREYKTMKLYEAKKYIR